MRSIELTREEEALLKSLEKPKYSFQDMENMFIEKGINPFAPWMKEDHTRVHKILDERKSPCDQ